MTRTMLPVALLASALVLTGCIYAPDRDSHGPGAAAEVRPTVGQELLDLQRARDQGALSDAEYQRLRDRLIDAR